MRSLKFAETFAEVTIAAATAKFFSSLSPSSSARARRGARETCRDFAPAKPDAGKRLLLEGPMLADQVNEEPQTSRNVLSAGIVGVKTASHRRPIA